MRLPDLLLDPREAQEELEPLTLIMGSEKEKKQEEEKQEEEQSSSQHRHPADGGMTSVHRKRSPH